MNHIGRERIPLQVGILQMLQFPFVRAYHQVEVVRPCRIPPRGGVILVCNHTSGADPMFIQAFCPRLIRWMMAAEYFDVPGTAWLFRALRIIPVQRSGRDLPATRQALRALREGGVIGIFPEGQIEKRPQLLPFQTGVGLLALQSGAAVLPVHIDGTQRNRPMVKTYLQPQRVRLGFGEPMRFKGTSADRTRLEVVTARIREGVRAAGSKVADSRPNYYRTTPAPADQSVGC